MARTKKRGGGSKATATATIACARDNSNNNNNKRSLDEMVPAAASTTQTAPPSSSSSHLPQKKFFRCRAHCNPLSHNDGFQYPLTSKEADWEVHYPSIAEEQRIIRFVDVGMGFGGLTVALASLFPDKLVLGMEIRPKVTEFVRLRIEALREEHRAAGLYQNAACLRTNCMRYFPNFFAKGQLEKIFFCFPDPHFKAKNHRRRIVSNELLSEYAFFLAPGARLYTITDVLDLHEWHVKKCDAHPCFERLCAGEEQRLLAEDPAVRAMVEETEEGKKVARMGGSKHFAVYRRRADSELPRPRFLELMEG